MVALILHTLYKVVVEDEVLHRGYVGNLDCRGYIVCLKI